MSPSKTSQPKPTNSLQIVGDRDKKVLSKNQQAFNRLTKRIETLEKEIASLAKKLFNLNEYYHKSISPLERELAEAQINAAMALDSTTSKFKLTKNNKLLVTDAIKALCIEAFMCIEPTPLQEAFYDKWSETTYKEEMEEQKSMFNDTFSNHMSSQFGMDVNMDELNEDPAAFAKFEEEIRKRIEESHNEKEPERKKTKKELEREMTIKTEEEMKSKNIRSIYIALAKILHPDSEPDEKLRNEKQEIMKKVTVAYEEKDLTTLMKLEMEWVHKTSEHLEKLTDNKLKLYVSALKEQVYELETEKQELIYNPRFSKIAELAHLNEQRAHKEILLKETLFDIHIKDFNRFVTTSEKIKTKQPALQFAEEVLMTYCLYDDDDDSFDDFFPF